MLAYYNTIATKIDVYCIEKELLKMAVAELLQDEGFNPCNISMAKPWPCGPWAIFYLTYTFST